MATIREAYVDTSALIAFVDRSDSHHPLFAKLFTESPPLVTTSLVLAEGHAWFLRRYGRRPALEFLAILQLVRSLAVMPVGSR
jgi:predicted nucleic acid-binding protein